MNIADHFLDVFESTADADAIISPNGQSITFRQLCNDVDHARSIVRASHLQSGARVVLQTPAGRHFAAWAVALVAEGMVVVAIDLAHGPDVYRDRARAVGADAVVCVPVVAAGQQASKFVRSTKLQMLIPPRLDVFRIVSRLDGQTTPGSSSATRTKAVVADQDDTAFIIFTGGTTSVPKGVRLSHRAIGSYVGALKALPEWDSISSFVADQPQQVLYGLAHNKTVHVAPSRANRHANHVAQLLFSDGVDAYFGSPTRWARILDTDAFASGDTAPRAVLLGGAPVTPATLTRLDEALPASTALRCIYGMTELGPVAHIEGREKLARSWDDGDYVGTLFPGIEAAVSAEGVLSVKSAARFSGYLGEPDARPGEPFVTGDLARLDGNELTLHGRTSDMIIADGVNLYAGQFESRVLALESRGSRVFSEIALVGATVDALGDERFVMFFRPTSTHEGIGAERARELIAPLFPDDLGPVLAIQLDTFPTTGRQGKLDRNELRAIAVRALDAPSLSRQRERVMADLKVSGVAKRQLLPLQVLTQRNLSWASKLPTADTHSLRHVFVLGHQRSGTTAMHRGLCASPSATSFAVGDMVLPRRATWKAMPVLPPLFDRVARRRIESDDRAEAIDAKHPLRLSEPEEEEWLLAGLGLSGFLPSAFPQTLGDERFTWLRRRDEWPSETLDELLETYARIAVAWRETTNVADTTTVIAKNPAFGPLATQLSDRFPSSKFVVMVRHPGEAISSRIELISSIHRRPLTTSEINVVVDDSVHQMEGLAVAVRKLSQDSVITVDSERFRRDSAATVRRIARELGFTEPQESALSFLGGSHNQHTRYRKLEVPEQRLPEFTRLYEEVSI